jgi:PAS domain S-box-containing protein
MESSKTDSMETLQLFASLIKGTNDLIHSVKPDGTFEFVNRAWLETLGYTANEIKSMRLSQILFPGQLKKHEEVVNQVFEGFSKAGIETTFLTKDGESVIVEGNLFPRKEGDKVIAATGFFRNISERRETEAQLKESRARTEFFVDLMVHDLMNITQELLSTFEVLLYDPQLPKSVEGLVHEGLTELERASDLISNVRKITRLYTEEHASYERDLHTAVQEAARRAETSFPTKKLVLDTDLEDGMYSVMADEFLDDVFFSLFHNSLKFDERNEVKVELEIEGIKHTPFLKLQVKDYGPGIPDEEKETIFSRLSHRRESVVGLGLGLTLVKQILENYGAHIRVEDRVEDDHTQGANFVILLRHQKGDVTEVDE